MVDSCFIIHVLFFVDWDNVSNINFIGKNVWWSTLIYTVCYSELSSSLAISIIFASCWFFITVDFKIVDTIDIYSWFILKDTRRD